MPALWRHWLRGAARRPGRALVIVMGFALMSATTAGALLAGDLLEALFVADAEAEWGEVDLEVRPDGNAVMPTSDGRTLGEEGRPTIVAAAPRLILQAAVTTAAGTDADVQLIGVGAEEFGFTTPEAVAGRADATGLAPDEAIVNERLADRLGISVGDEVTIVAAVPRWLEDVRTSINPVVHQPFTVELQQTVVGIAADVGVADLHRTSNVLMRRGVVELRTGLQNRATVTHLRVADRSPSGVRAGLDALGHLASPMEIDIEAVRLDAIALAEDDGGLFRSILLTLSLLVVAAAAVAARGLLVTLAEERAQELALLRVIGVRRGRAAWLLRLESTVYGAIGGMAGGAIGLPLGTLMAGLLSAHFADLNAGRGREQVLLDPSIDAGTVVTAVALIIAVAAITGGSAAREVLAGGPAGALRGGGHGPVEIRPTARRVTLTAAAGALFLGLGAAAGGSLILLGLSTLLGAWWMSVRARADLADLPGLDRRAAALGLLWAVTGSVALTDAGDGVQAAFGVLIIGGATAIVCAAVLLRTDMRRLTRHLRALLPLGQGQAALIIAAARSERERRRTTTTMVTLGIVLFMVAALSVLGSAQALDAERQGGGFEVFARSVGEITDRQWREVPGIQDAAVLSETWLPQTDYWADAGDGPLTVPYPVRIAAPRSRAAQVQRFGLADAVDGVTSAADALAVVSGQQGSAVVDRAALPEGAAVGDDILIDGGAAPRRLRLIAVLDTYLLSTVLVHEGDLAGVAQLNGPNRAWLRLTAGAEPSAVVETIEDSLSAVGATAQTVAQVREDVIAVNRRFTDVFALLLLLGLLVGVASVAAYVVRAARERRQQLAVTRALGMSERSVAVSLAAEPLLAAVVGTVVGLLVGLGLLRVLFAVGLRDLAFVVDWTRVSVSSGGAVALVAITSAITARASMPSDVATGLRDLG